MPYNEIYCIFRHLKNKKNFSPFFGPTFLSSFFTEFYQLEMFWLAFSYTAIISLIPNVLLYLIPINIINDTVFGINFRHIMLSFASSAMLSDVLLHMIPHLLMPHDHHHHDNHSSEDHHHLHHHDDHSSEDHHHHHHDDDDHDHQEIHSTEGVIYKYNYDEGEADSYNHFMSPEEHPMHHNHHDEGVNDVHMRSTIIMLLVIFGFFLFMFTDKIMTLNRILSGSNNSSGCGHSHTHGISNINNSNQVKKDDNAVADADADDVDDANNGNNNINIEDADVDEDANAGQAGLRRRRTTRNKDMNKNRYKNKKSKSSNSDDDDDAGDSSSPGSGNGKTVKAVRRTARSRSRSRAAPKNEKETPQKKTQIKSSSNSQTNSNNNNNDNNNNSSSSIRAILRKISPSGILNLLADFLHNISDGILIGAACAPTASTSTTSLGLSTSAFLSVLLHEIPHELSDFSILIEAGMTKGEAIRAQFITALGAFLGTIVGYYIATSGNDAGHNDERRAFTLALMSGGFLYLSTVGILPSISISNTSTTTSTSDRNHTGGGDTGGGVSSIANQTLWTQTCLEAIAFVCGVGLMLVVALLEGMDEAHSH